MTDPPQPPPSEDRPQDPYALNPYGQNPYAPQDPYAPQGPYAQNPYGQHPYGSGAPAPAAPQGSLNLAGLLGARSRRRPEARFGSALAAAGAFLALAGAAVWSIGYFVDGFGIDFNFDGGGAPTTHGESRRFLGAGLFLVIALAGYAAVIMRRRGPLATAGTVASAGAVPILLSFLFLDIGATFQQGAFPINIDAVYLISILVWLVSYFGIPGARGRAVYLGLAAAGIYTYIAFKVAGQSALQTGATAFNGSSSTLPGTNDHGGTIATIGLIFGLGYYAIAAVLDRRQQPGAAIAMLYAAFGATVGGIAADYQTVHQVGTGVTLIVVGGALAVYGGRFGRRFTTWIWSAGIVLGIILIVAEIGLDHDIALGIVLLVIGIVVAAVAPLLAGLTGEGPDLDETSHQQVAAPGG